MYVTKVFFVN